MYGIVGTLWSDYLLSDYLDCLTVGFGDMGMFERGFLISRHMVVSGLPVNTGDATRHNWSEVMFFGILAN